MRRLFCCCDICFEGVFLIIIPALNCEPENQRGELSLSDNNHIDDEPDPLGCIAKGALVFHYRIIRPLGSGGMGEVWLAEDTKLGRSVALKFLPTQCCRDESVRTRFIREAQAAAQLNHPNIITIYEVNEYKMRPFFAMEYVDGVSLDNYIKEQSQDIRQVVDLAVQISGGLAEAHGKGIIHRDIKPSNILVDKNGRLRILDFGLAFSRGMLRITETGGRLGTIAYMSPEQSRGEKLDQRSDIFSFGVVLYQMITGRLPFDAEYDAAIIYAIVHDNPEPLARYKADVPDNLQRIVDKTLDKNPETRYQSLSDLLVDLRRVGRELKGLSEETLSLDRKQQPSIAVLPFTNLSADREQEYFCDGMAEEIINVLTHLEGLRIVARTSAFSFKNKEIDIREIGRRLNVDTVLEGSVRKAGNHLRIGAQLINVHDGYHLWSEKFDRDAEDIFAVQDEISLAIVDKLKVKLLKDEKAKLVKRFTDNMEAYSLYLKGRYFWNRRYEIGMQKAMVCFQQAIEKDPLYALAYTGIADCYNQLGHFGMRHPQDAYPKAKAAAAKALEIDDTLAEAHASLGWTHTFHDWDWPAAENQFKCALTLNPNYAPAHEWYGLYLGVVGKFEEAVAQARRGLELDPVSLVFNSVAGLAYYWMRSYDEAIDQLNRTLEMDRDFSIALLFNGFALTASQRWDEAISALKKFATISNNSPLGLGHLGYAYALANRKDDAMKTLNLLDELSKERYVSPLSRALVYMGLGDKERALDHLEKAFEERESWITTLKTAPYFDTLRFEPRFTALIKKMHYD